MPKVPPVPCTKANKWSSITSFLVNWSMFAKVMLGAQVFTLVYPRLLWSKVISPEVPLLKSLMPINDMSTSVNLKVFMVCPPEKKKSKVTEEVDFGNSDAIRNIIQIADGEESNTENIGRRNSCIGRGIAKTNTAFLSPIFSVLDDSTSTNCYILIPLHT